MKQIVVLIACTVMMAPASCASTQGSELALTAEPGAPSPEHGLAAQMHGDPADTLYQAARAALNENRYEEAVTRFQEVRDRYPGSAHASDALYWEAFAMYRNGGAESLRSALVALEHQRTRYPEAATQGDAEALTTRIHGALADLGDEKAADLVAEEATRANGACAGENEEVRIEALNALVRLDVDRAVPVFRRILADRDDCAAPLRERVVFLAGRNLTPETGEILLEAARGDPDLEVRSRAVRSLSGVVGDAATDVLEEVLRTSDDPELTEAAIFALASRDTDRRWRILRTFIAISGTPDEAVQYVIVRMGRDGSEEDAANLRELYGQLADPELKTSLFTALRRLGGEESVPWLLARAMDPAEPLEVRERALFNAGRMDAPMNELVTLYDRVAERDLRERLLLIYARRGASEGTAKLIEVARGEPDDALRSRAISALGRSNDPRAAEALVELIDP